MHINLDKLINTRRRSALILGMLLALSLPATASAHVLKVDGNIGVELHIEPTDHPVSGEPTHYILEFSDDTQHFDLQHCDCSIAFVLDGRIVTTKSLAVTDQLTSKDTYTFSKPGNYTFKVSGKSDGTVDFAPFAVEYPVHVAQGDTPVKSSPILVWVAIGLGVGLILATAIYMERRPQKRSSKPEA